MGKSLDELYSAETPDNSGENQVADVPAKVEAEAEAPKADAAPAEVAKEGAPPAPEDQASENVPRAALTDERKKRQALEAANRELIKRLEGIEKRLNEPEQRTTVDPLVDPDGFMRELEVARFEDKLELSSEFMRSQVGEAEFAAAEQAVLNAANNNPQFAERFANEVARSKNPGRYTYQIGKAIIDQIEANDPVKAREKLEADIEARIIAKYGLTPVQASNAGNSQQPTTHAKPSVPTSLAGLQSNGPRNTGPRPVQRRSLAELYKT